MPIPQSDFIWYGGKFVPWDEATIHVTAHVLHYGSSAFEGIRAYDTSKGPAIVGLKEHIRRLFDSCRIIRLEVPFTQEQMIEACIETVRRNGHKSCYIRPLVFRGPDSFSLNARSCPTEVVIITFEWGRYLGAEAIENGVDVMVSSWRRMAPDTFPAMAKGGGNYLNSQYVAMEAADHGYVEGIALDVNGFVSEGSGENIFVVYRGEIYTPPMGASILLGITREFVIALAKEMGYVIREQLFSRELLYVADEVFFTGTAAEITPVRSVDQILIGNGGRGPITQRIQDEYFGIISGLKPDRYGWLTFVK
ncbi:MAG: branched-chain amino acid transaminase [Anaerolineales bacterium]|nr:MAG: branched-chain amino acid transaminase [Anaerolineales bacterium]